MSTNTPVFGLFQYNPITDGNLPFNITQALNNNWNAIDSLALPAAAAASPYNPSGTYAVGDFCIYNGTLQKCNTPIPSGEAWNAAHWTIVTLTQLLSPLGGATTPQAALAALGAGVRPNELDNACFVGGGTGWGVFPVNQRGVSGKISTPGYFIDRWKLISGTVQITAAGLVLNGTIAQILPNAIGSVYTATALTTTGLVTCQYDDASRTFSITGTGQTFVFAKLEQGAEQTAAYQDQIGAWHQLQQPESDYATQLLKCQQYYIEYRMYNVRFPAVINRGVGFATVQTPIQMAKKPVFQLLSPDYGVLYDATAVPNGASVTEMDANSVVIQLTFPSDAGVMSANWGQCWFALDTGM